MGAFCGAWRLMSVDGMEWDVPDTEANRAAFGSRGGSEGPGAYPKIRVVTVSECASHAAVLAAMGPAAGGKGGGEQSLARELLRQLQEDWLLIADRNFYCFKDWCAAADTGAALLWRVKSDIRLPVLELLPDGSYRSVLVNPKITWNKRKALLEAAARGDDLEEDQARYVRVVEYEVPDREGDGSDRLIALVTTITDARLARRRRWLAYHSSGSTRRQPSLGTNLRGGKVLRARSPALAGRRSGATCADPLRDQRPLSRSHAACRSEDRVKFTRTLRIIRRAVGPAFPP
jgi:hypothetical protein